MICLCVGEWDVVWVVEELECVGVDVEDPHADSDELQHEYGFGLTKTIDTDYDVVIITVPHNEYKKLDDAYYASITKEHGMVADLKGI